MQKADTAALGSSLRQVFGQPAGQALPQDFLAMLAALNRSQDTPRERR